MRVAAIAIDAAEWWYLERLLDEGRLPNLARLRARAAHFPLKSPVPYRSELVWARFLTGREPITDKQWPVGVTFDPDDYGIGTNPATTERPFYALGAGTKVIALDLIHSSPAADVDGVQVIGWGSHSPQWPRCARPKGLVSELDARFGTNPAFGNDFNVGWYQPDFLDALTSASRTGGGRRTDIARWLLEQHPDWDLFITCISEFHSGGHHMWHGVDDRHPLHGHELAGIASTRQREITEAVDAEIGRLLEVIPDDAAVMVFAMHGFQPADDLMSTVLMPELFHRLHHGRPALSTPDVDAWRRAGMPAITPPADEQWGDYARARFALSTKQRIRRAGRGVLGRRGYEALRHAAGKSSPPPMSAMANPIPPEVDDEAPGALDPFRKGPDYEVAAWYRPTWSSMPWFALPSFADGHVRINLAGRERNGIVPAEDYARACEEVTATLRACRDVRTGRPVVSDVLHMRDDPFDPDGPDADLLVIIDEAPDAIEHPEVGVVGPFPHLRTAHHSSNGFALVAAPGVQPGVHAERDAIDLTPTVLRLLGRDDSACLGESLVQLVR